MVEHGTSAVSGMPQTVLEKSGEGIAFPPACTQSAAGLQGEQPLVDRTKWIREVGKIDP